MCGEKSVSRHRTGPGTETFTIWEESLTLDAANLLSIKIWKNQRIYPFAEEFISGEKIIAISWTVFSTCIYVQ